MFNQKVNGFVSENPSYLNYSYGAPLLKPQQIHECGTTILKYNKVNKCNSLPLQSWCSPNVAVESFGMRPIVNSKEYFEYLSKYFSSIIYTDSILLNNSNLARENYTLFEDKGLEPDSSFLQAINLEITNRLSFLMAEASGNVFIFAEYNPLCEGLIVTDIDIVTYRSVNNPNHFFHRVLFSVFNTTRYNTISLKAELYQDTTPMMDDWNKVIQEVQQSIDVQKPSSNSIIYVSFINYLNNTTCVLGQESECEYKGYNLSGSFSQLLNDKLLKDPKDINWLQPNSLSNGYYTDQGNYDENGNIKIVDTGLPNLDKLINLFKV
jgi:hypothetical protein